MRQQTAAPAKRHSTMAEAALDELHEAILSGELAPGAPLRLEELARRGPSITVHERRDEHERILAACARHEPDEAGAELSTHLSRTANLIARRMGALDLF